MENSCICWFLKDEWGFVMYLDLGGVWDLGIYVIMGKGFDIWWYLLELFYN